MAKYKADTKLFTFDFTARDYFPLVEFVQGIEAAGEIGFMRMADASPRS